jgi:hypothetical protein
MMFQRLMGRVIKSDFLLPLPDSMRHLRHFLHTASPSATAEDDHR